jgi:CelD/BcsL family acetyltransferase involved in cellulose biosynthesis
MAFAGDRSATDSSARPAATGLAFSVAPSPTAVLAEWAALSARASGDNLFFHPDFAIPAIRHLGADVAIATVADASGRLAALAPFTRTRLGRVAPATRLWAHEYAPLGLPLVDRAALRPAAATLIEGLAPAVSGASLIVPDLPLDSAVARALVEASRDRPIDILDGHVRAVLKRAPGQPVDVRGMLSARRRKEYARLMRRLRDVGEVLVTAAIEPQDVRARFEDFMALEAAGWKGKRGSALLSRQATADFAREVVAARADAGSARIDSIDLGGRPIAAVVSFAVGETASTWKIAYDETWARFSPGAQLMLEVVGGLFSDPTLTAIDSCATADHPMIDHLWPGRLAIGTLVIGPPGGSLAHRVGVATARAEFAARAALRRFRT